jgi:adenylate cyclase
MASIVPGYAYDIFISYRHNDNRSGWVTQFVNAVQEELATTLKEALSVYFDTNPHDGLLETHNVDKSLEGKLKCLIFIPIISLTYCDTKSFAWQHEFVAFNKLATEDQFGRDIRLGNGNVASRILPIKIHDIDEEDKTLLENELGGMLRSIEFIYKEPGVNRPLKVDDKGEKNLRSTIYNNQINKVANAVKEIIRGLGHPSDSTAKTAVAHPMNFSDEPHMNVAGKSIAVLPFADMSPARDQEYLGDGLAEGLINILSQIKELKVSGRSSSFSFKNRNVDLTTIGKTLNVENILDGSVQKLDSRVRITAQLINATDGFHMWSQRYDREMDDIFSLQDDICSNISEHLKVTLFQDQESNAVNRPTKNTEAYELFLKGDFYCKKYSEEGYARAIEYFRKAVELDPEYADAWWYLGFVNFEMHGWLNIQKEKLEIALNCANKAISIDETNAYGHLLLALIHFTYDYDWRKVESEIALGNKYTHTQFPTFSFSLEPWYRAMLYGDFDFAVHRLKKGVEHDPLNFYYQFHLAQIYLYGVRDYKKTISVLKGILELGFPEKKAWRPACLAYLFEEEYEMAEEYARKDYDASGGRGHGAAHLIMCLAASGKNEEAQKLYQLVKKTVSLSEFPYILHAKANIYLNNPDEAFEYLNKAISEKNFWLFALKYSPEWDSLRTDSRFDKVLERMNFPK